MFEFSSFNQILLSLFDISNVYHDSIELTLKRKCVTHCKELKYYHKVCLKRKINLTKFGYKH